MTSFSFPPSVAGQYATRAACSRLLFGRSGREADVSALVEAVPFATNAAGEVNFSQVQTFAAASAVKTYVAADRATFITDSDTGFFVPTSDPVMKHCLALGPNNGRATALAAWGQTLPPGHDVTGWWPMNDAAVAAALKRRAVIVGVTVTFVTEAGRIVGLACTDGMTRRHAFVFERLSDEEVAALRGRVHSMNQTGRYFRL